MACALVANAGAARAEQDTAAQAKQPSWDARVASSTSEGAFLPLSLTPRVTSRELLVTGWGGYDSARRSAAMDSAVEVRIFGPLALRAGFAYTNTTIRLRPSIGARVQFLEQERVGLDAAAGVFYKPEGLTEPEGEIETVLSFGRQFGKFSLLGNLAYGQDPEGNERDGEVRFGALAQFGRRWHSGLDTRWRFDLGSNQAKLKAANEPTFDLIAGPLVALNLGPVAVTAQVGVSTLRLLGVTSTGVIALAGLGTAL